MKRGATRRRRATTVAWLQAWPLPGPSSSSSLSCLSCCVTDVARLPTHLASMWVLALASPSPVHFLQPLSHHTMASFTPYTSLCPHLPPPLLLFHRHRTVFPRRHLALLPRSRVVDAPIHLRQPVIRPCYKPARRPFRVPDEDPPAAIRPTRDSHY